MKLLRVFIVFLILIPAVVNAKVRKVDDFHWTGVERIIAIADLHGDYDRYFDVMQSAGLINSKGKWVGGTTHLVQTGDITDRGPDSKKIIDHMNKLAKQARKKGGYVHMLIGNHEVMNVIGDLRYVSEGEYQAFTTRRSERLQELQWQRQLEWMKSNTPDFDKLDIESVYADWKKQVPLGWVEHRQAWTLTGPYGQWVKDNKVAVQINDTIFLHGGISHKYCKLSLESITGQAIAAMENFDPSVTTIIDDPLGPFWYRGYAQEEASDVYIQTLDNILERYNAKRIVVGHSPTGGVIWPRFEQRVILTDTGIAKYYGAHKGVLELTAEGATAIYDDKRLALPRSNEDREDYLRAVIEIDSNNGLLKKRLAEMLAPPPGIESQQDAAGHINGSVEMDPQGSLKPIPSPGNCQ